MLEYYIPSLRKKQEQYIIVLILSHDKNIQNKIFEKIEPKDIEDENVRKIYEFIIDLKNEYDINKIDILSKLKDEELIKELTEIIYIDTQNADNENDGYEYTIWLYENNNLKALTDMGKEGSFIWDDNDTLLFSSIRKESDKKRVEAGEEFSVFYRLSLQGGEALKAFTLPVRVSEIEKMNNAEKERRKKAVSAAIKAQLAENRANSTVEINENLCEDIITATTATTAITKFCILVLLIYTYLLSYYIYIIIFF